MDVHAGFVQDLGLVLAVAAVAAFALRRMGQPTVLGYLAAGLVVGPYLPVPLFADPDRVHALSEFGVVLVMFGVGLELRLRRLLQALPASGFTALVQISAMAWLGYSAGILLGWDHVSSLFLGGCLAISSTMVVSKVFAHHPVDPTIREHVFGVLVMQDVAAVALITLFTAVAAGGGVSVADFALTVGELLLVLVAMLAGGMLIVPRAVRAARDLGDEVQVVLVVAVCFGLAWMADALGYSVALGGFVGGVLVAESGEAHDVEPRVKPIEDVFAAVFFVSVGMTVDPALVVDHLGAALLVTAVVLVGQLVTVTGAGVLSGLGLRRSLVAGLCLGQVGEFGFVIAGIGRDAGVVDQGLLPVVVTAAVLTTFTTPFAVRASERVVHAVENGLPQPLRNLIVFYATWFERVRTASKPGGRLPRAIASLVVDGVLLIALAAATAAWFTDAVFVLRLQFNVGVAAAAGIVGGIVVGLSAPLLAILVRSTREVADAFVERAMPEGPDASPLPSHLIRLAVQMLVLVGIGLPGIAVLRPTLDGPYGASVLVAVLLALGVAMWRAARTTDDEMRSAAGRLLEVLAQQSGDEPEPHLERLLPGIDEMIRLRVEGDMACAGRTLAELDLRARTGATVVAILRPDGPSVALPTGHDRVAPGDTVMLLGPPEAAQRAEALLRGGASAHA